MPGQTLCSVCESGRYSDLAASSFCSECPIGSLTKQLGGSSVFDCVCPQGSFGAPWIYDSNAKHSVCTSCPLIEGMSCFFNSTIPFVFSGFWRVKNSTIVKRCIPMSSCNFTEYLPKTTCSYGYEGNLCGDCLSGSHYRSFGKCRLCPSNGLVLFYILMFLTIVLIFLGYEIAISRPVSRLDMRVALLWIQIFALFGKLSESLPNPLANILRFLSIFNLDFDIFSFRKLRL
jgi:hypothetical protein